MRIPGAVYSPVIFETALCAADSQACSPLSRRGLLQALSATLLATTSSQAAFAEDSDNAPDVPVCIAKVAESLLPVNSESLTSHRAAVSAVQDPQLSHTCL